MAEPTGRPVSTNRRVGSDHGHDSTDSRAIGLAPPLRYKRYESTPSLLSATPCATIARVPAAVAVTVGASGVSGTELPPVGPNRVRPCWGTPLTWAWSPPTKIWVPSVAITCGPTVVSVPGLPPFVF